MSSFPTPPPSTTPILNPDPPTYKKKEVDLMLYTVNGHEYSSDSTPTKKFSTSSSTVKSSAI